MTSNGDTLLEVIAQALNVEPSRIDQHSSMATMKEWDSLGHLQVCLAVQERFGVVLDLDAIAEAPSVPALRALIHRSRPPPPCPGAHIIAPPRPAARVATLGRRRCSRTQHPRRSDEPPPPRSATRHRRRATDVGEGRRPRTARA